MEVNKGSVEKSSGGDYCTRMPGLPRERSGESAGRGGVGSFVRLLGHNYVLRDGKKKSMQENAYILYWKVIKF